MIELLSLSGYTSGQEWEIDPQPRTWEQAHAEIERAWKHPDVWRDDYEEALSIVVIWRARDGLRVMHWSGQRGMWVALCASPNLLRMYADLVSVEFEPS